MKKWIFISVLALSAIFCNLPVTAPKVTDTAPATDAASPLSDAATATAKASHTQTSTGTIVGKLSYPADSLPPMRIAAFDVATGKVTSIDTVAGQSTYSLDLPVGTYHIVAYSIASGSFPGGIAGGYTNAVPCGLAAECADHTLIDVTVTAGVTLPDINPGDFYGVDGTFPPMP
jgi:hypothetical protein